MNEDSIERINGLLGRIEALLRANIELANAMQCLAYALGKQPGIDAPQLRDDFLSCVELFWKLDTVPQSVVNLMMQLEAGGLKKDRGID